MCWEQSRQKRTMATSRSEATTTESSPEKCQRQRPALHGDRWTNKNRRPRPALPLRKNQEGNRFRLTNSFGKGPTSMRKPLSRPEQDENGTSQTSIRHHPPRRSAMRVYAVAPIPTGGVALRHVGPRDAT